ncbi:MAG TPA: TetR/AcrR family transcriptional regulator [Verrucomicrobiae bacterium]|jgi:TetR/AcrR family transcriptional repressor of nem operon|nr:TetR/AcrR family transcriptional regulator [Verrucomicrobiae bacterium]
MLTRSQKTEEPGTKLKLLDAAVVLMRRKGFAATTVDEICAEAGVTKGGFFHYFKTKDDIAKAAIERFYESKAVEFQEAPFRKLADPLDRVFGRLDFAKKSSGGSRQVTKGCLLGMFAQELSFTNPGLRDTCRSALERIAADFEKDLAEAKAIYSPKMEFEPRSVAMLYLSIIQGSQMMAKVAESNAVLAENIEQFRRYLQSIFGVSPSRARKPGSKAFDSSSN